MTTNIGVVDYGMGNLHSVAKALAVKGDRVTVSNDSSTLSSSDVLVLPGVGSFGAAMKNLSALQLDDFIRGWIKDGKPYLGICLGLQLLFEESEEDPGVPGLGALKGRVVRFQKKDFTKETYTIPHMGWNTTERKKKSSLFKGINEKDSFYFVHTFFPAPKDKDVILTTTNYGKAFCSSVETNNIYASQFHPEKSGRVGLALLSNVLTRMVA